MWIRYKGWRNLILAFWRCLTYQKLPSIKFAELENNPQRNTTKPNYIYITIERYVDGWCTSFNTLCFFVKTLMILLYSKWRLCKLLYWRENSIINSCYNMASKITSDNSQNFKPLFSVKRNTHKMVMCNCFWPKLLNICSIKYGIVPDQKVCFIGWKL